jgi:hypothetical protein
MTASSSSSDGAGMILPLSKELRAGLFLMLAGAVVLVLVWGYPSGTLSEIGPGAMPQLAGGLILLLGILMVLRGWRQATTAAGNRISPRAFVIPGAMAAFAILLPWLGLAFTAAIATVIAGFGSRDLSVKERLLGAAVLSAFVTALFGYGLRLQVAIWPWSY